MSFDLMFFLFGIPAVIIAGISKAGFGSGAAFVGGAILALVIDPALALGVVLPLFMIVDAASLRPYWGGWHWPSVKTMLIGALPGVALATVLFTIVNDDVFRFLIGAMCLWFVGFQVLNERGWISIAARPFRAWEGVLTGTVAGFTSFVSHAGGPPAAVFLLGQKLDKTVYQATTVIVFAVINVMKFVPYLWLGIFTRETVIADLLLAPFALIGAWLGVKAHRLIPARRFFQLTYVLLTVTGVRLIWVALS